jgi:hypothetical protein
VVKTVPVGIIQIIPQALADGILFRGAYDSKS